MQDRPRHRPGRLGRLAAIVGVLCVAAVAPAVASGAEIEHFTAELSNLQAGGHADATTSFRFATEPAPGRAGVDGCFGAPCNVIVGGAAKDILIDLPKGLVGNPQAAPQCTLDELTNFRCPVASQVGYMDLTVLLAGTPWGPFPTAIYNLQPERGEVAKFGFRAINGSVNSFISVTLADDGTYAVRTNVANVFDGNPVLAVDLTIWGVPADPAHDAQRACFGSSIFGCNAGTVVPRPFLAAPAECGVDGLATLRVDTYQEPGRWEVASSEPQQVTGCDRLSFEGSVSAAPTTRAAASPTGLDVDLSIPQHFDVAGGVETPPLRTAVVTLPRGATVSPASADGLGGCSMDEIGVSATGVANGAPVRCPLSSKIGSVSGSTPLLAEPLDGSIYLARQSENPFGTLLGLYLVVKSDERGLLIKLPGRVDADPITGQLTATFADNPQLPFDHLRLKFKSGDRAPLVSPSACGTYTTHSVLTSWGGQRSVSDSSFTIDQGCGQETRFEPSFDAGLTNPQAGSSSPFTLTLSRPDGQQDISGLDVVLPPGLLGNIASVPLCAEAQAATGTCGAESRVGGVTAFAGAGGSPVAIPQAGKAPTAVYLAGPYKGAPFSLSIVVPAQAGPFDLGTVVVRAALFVDAHDAHVTVVSDPLPTILQGIPLQIQRIDVTIDRPGFMVSPTSCAAKAVGATVRSAAGATAGVTSRFRVSDCDALAFDPGLNLALTNKSQTKDGGHPGVLALVKQARGESGISNARVELPLHLALDPDNANGLCEYDDGLRSECPAVSIVGRAVAVSPILRQPLTGPVYFVKGVRFNARGERVRTLPTLLVKLTGENGLRLDLRARSDIDQDTGQLVNTFQDVPDAPISSFSLQIDGGKHGILVVTHNQDICKPAIVPDGVALTDHPGAAIAADADFTGHSTKTLSDAITMATPCNLQVYSRTYTASRMSVTTGGFMGPGTLKITGTGVKTTTRKIAGDSTDMATITASLNATGKRLRKAKRTLKVRVSFDPKARGRKTEAVSYPKAKKQTAKRR